MRGSRVLHLIFCSSAEYAFALPAGHKMGRGFQNPVLKAPPSFRPDGKPARARFQPGTQRLILMVVLLVLGAGLRILVLLVVLLLIRGRRARVFVLLVHNESPLF